MPLILNLASGHELTRGLRPTCQEAGMDWIRFLVWGAFDQSLLFPWLYHPEPQAKHYPSREAMPVRQNSKAGKTDRDYSQVAP